jgi:hypothetical protein
MEWYHYGVAAIFSLMIISPVWFFSKLENFLFDTPEEPDLYVNFINPRQVIIPEEPMDFIVNDEKVLNNLKKMVEKAETDEARHLWSIKKSEFEREMRWKLNLIRAGHA